MLVVRIVVVTVLLVVEITGLLRATLTIAVVAAVLVVVELNDVEVAIDWVACCRSMQPEDTAFEGHEFSSDEELIPRCEPLQLLPQEIFTEQLILS